VVCFSFMTYLLLIFTTTISRPDKASLNVRLAVHSSTKSLADRPQKVVSDFNKISLVDGDQ